MKVEIHPKVSDGLMLFPSQTGLGEKKKNKGGINKGNKEKNKKKFMFSCSLAPTHTPVELPAVTANLGDGFCHVDSH